MKRLLYIPLALFCMLLSPSCIEEDLDACPPEGGGLAVTLRAEKFRTRPPYASTDLEEDFAARIHSLQYLLYADGRLIEQGILGDVQSAHGGSYVFRHDTLPFGAYRLAFAANVTSRMMTGRLDSPEDYCIAYQGVDKGDDHFRADLDFEVTCPCSNEFDAVLHRVHGVTRFRFANIPDGVEAVEVSLDNIGERMPLCGDPDRACVVVKRVPAAELRSRAAGAFSLGTFCTLPGVRTSWRMKLYGADADAPIYDRVVTDTLRIESNQLIDLTARFKESGGIDFSVDVDTTWDGSSDGGGGVVISRQPL